MSGHSKWSTIKRQKGANDAKKGLAFTKHSNAITMAVREGGGISDPSDNFRLRLAIDAARAENMPKDTIERAISRGEGKNATEMFDVVYEGFGPGGFSVIVEAITDNKMRTTPEIKSIFDKSGGTLGVPGSVNYQFVKKGQIILSKDEKSLDEIFLIAADHGAEDVEEEDGEVIVYTAPEALSKVRSSLEENGITVKSAELLYKPIVMKDIPDQLQADKAIAFMEKLEDYGDVQKVYANFAIL